MQCDQIRLYLTEYVEGSLPGFKAAWVVQHLAGCPACSAIVAKDRHRVAEAQQPPVAAVVEQAARTSDTEFRAVQRPVPVGLRVGAAVLVAAGVIGALWLLANT